MADEVRLLTPPEETALGSTPSTGRRRPPLPWVLGGLIAVGIVAAAVAGFVYFFGQAAPSAVSLATASPSSGTGVSPAASASASSSASSPAASGSDGSGGLDGTWTVDTSIGSFTDFSDSFVGYRVDEQLANVGASTAVGRTPKVTGSLTASGTTITAATITADLTALQSDRSMRDGQLRTQAIQTATYPTATFVLSEPIQLDHLPAQGETISATAVGNLTLHGVTNRVSIDLQAKLENGVVTVVGSLPITFADYSISPPRSMLVLSVADHGTMELQLHFTKS